MKPTPTTSSGTKQQAKTDYAPKGSQKPNSTRGTPGETGERLPSGVKASDAGGERKAKINGGVGMGKADDSGTAVDGTTDGVGRDGMGKHDYGEFNSGRSEANCYDHKRVPHDQGNKGA